MFLKLLYLILQTAKLDYNISQFTITAITQHLKIVVTAVYINVLQPFPHKNLMRHKPGRDTFTKSPKPHRLQFQTALDNV